MFTTSSVDTRETFSALKPQHAENHRALAIGQRRKRWHGFSSDSLQSMQDVSAMFMRLSRLSLVGRALTHNLQRNIFNLSGAFRL